MLSIILAFFFSSDCRNLEEDLNISEYVAPTSTSSSAISSNSNLNNPGAFRQHVQTSSNQRISVNLLHPEHSIITDSQVIAGPSNVRYLRSSNKDNNDEANKVEPVITGPADSSLEDNKGAKYKERRQRNNMAAKKSRDARRIRENQLKIKVLCLENANQVLREQVHREKEENQQQSDKIKILERQIKDLQSKKECTTCLTLSPKASNGLADAVNYDNLSTASNNPQVHVTEKNNVV